MRIEYRAFIGQYDWGFTQQQVGIIRCEDTTGIMAIDMDTNTTVGACIFDNWSANSVQTHFMITSPLVLKHGFLETCFEYVFGVEGKAIMYGQVPSNNTKALKLNKHMGFTEKCVLEGAYAPNVDYIIMEMRKENCRYYHEVIDETEQQRGAA